MEEPSFYDDDEDVSFDLDSPLDEVVLPYQGEDWEFGTDNQQSLPYLDADGQWEDLVPYTAEQLASFYHNPFLGQSEFLTNQFLETSKDYNSEFKQLLITLKKATEVIAQLQKDCNEKGVNIQGLCQKIFDNETRHLKAEGYCQDQRKVHQIHRYTLCKFNEQIASQLGVAILDCQQLSVEDTMLAMYTRTFSQLQCEQFLFDTTTKVRHHTKTFIENTDNAKSSILVNLAEESLDTVRQCVNTLFHFIRKDDNEAVNSFAISLQKWICQLVSLLYELARNSGYRNLIQEERYVVNHIIRSPPNTQSWADKIVQISGPIFETETWDQKTFIDHVIHMLFLVLRAPKGRGEFLSPSKSSLSIKSGNTSEENWTFLDENGDDIKGVGSQWFVLPKESDLVSLYQQIPFEKILSNIFILFHDEHNVYSYKNDSVSSEKFLQTLACFDIMCDVLGEGLATLGTPRYKQLVRRIAQTLRNIVLLTAEHWNHLKENVDKQPQVHSVERLQTEFDEFVKRCVERLLSVARLGVYQFLADLPFTSVSQRAAETLYVLMNVPAGSRAEVDQLAMTKYTRQEWLDFVQDSDTKLAFEDQLSGMPENEIVYLLTTFCNLAHARPASEDHLVNIIAMDIYMVSFVYTSTRDICSKMGRELLYTVASIHPFIISTILQFLNNKSDDISSTAFYAVSDLPFGQWIPNKKDVELLRSWILEHPITSIPVRLVQVVLKGMNWGFGEDGCLFLPHSLHCEIALLLVEVCHAYETEKKQSGILLKSFDQVSRVASVMRSSLSIDETFQSWTWEMLLRLKLHRSQLNFDENAEHRDKPTSLMDANDGTLLPRANSENLPQACYTTIMMTNVGHSMNVFLQQGIQLLRSLTESGHKTAAVQCLAFVVPMFIQGGIDLSINMSFINTLHSCILSDVSVLSGIAQKFVEQTPKVPMHLELLMGAINDLTNGNNTATVLTYWIKMVLATPGWWDDDNSKILLDFLFKCSFHDSPECSFECGSVLYERYYELMTHAQKNSHLTSPQRQNRSMISSLISALSGGSNGAPTFLQGLTSNFAYLSYYMISAEIRFEDDCKLWTTMLPLMKGNSPEAALKKASSHLKLQHTPLLYQLSIYRIAKLTILTDEKHPLMPAICQKFFLRFIHIDPYISASMGTKFFKTPSEAVIYKKLEAKFITMSDVHAVDSEFETKLQKLYRTFSVWLEEEKLHDDHLYLPSLPSHYEPQLLAKVRTQNQTVWSQYINYDVILDEIKAMNKIWVDFHIHNLKSFPAHSSSLAIHATSSQRITQLLRQFESPLNLDPSLCASIDFPILVDQLVPASPDTLVGDIEQDLKSVLTHAQSFAESKVKLENLNRNYLELLPDLYTNEEQRKLLKIECQSSFSPTHRCAGPAQVQVRYLEKVLNDIASENLKNNRASYRDIIASITDPKSSEDFSYSAVHLISVVQALVKKTQQQYVQNDNKTLFECGAKLFYDLADLNSDERWQCPPTRHLLVSCIDLLGQVFIYGQPDQAVPLLEQMLKRPETAALLSAHFSPAKSCKIVGRNILHNEFDTTVFVNMYERVVNAASNGKSSDVLFVLITKFDLENWCVDYSPPKIDRTTLLEAIISGLVTHSTFSWPRQENSEENTLTRSQSTQLSNSAVQEVFMTHLSILIQHSVSQIFFECVNSLLKASVNGSIDPLVWEVLNETTFGNSHSETENTGSLLSYECVDRCVKLLAVYFSDERRKTKSGLYATWKPYVHQISKLLYNLSFFEINFSEKMQKLNGATHFMHHASLVDKILPLFSAWLDPFTLDDGKMQFPWKPNDEDTVGSILKVFASLLDLVCTEKTLDVSQCIASLWGFYLDNTLLSHEKVSPSYMCGSYQTMLSALPWNKFIPNLTDLDRMVQLCSSKLECSLHFLCHIVPEIDWNAIMRMCNTAENDGQKWAEHTSEVLSYLLQVLLILGSDELRMNSYVKLQHFFTSIDNFPWHLIGYDQFDSLANIIADKYNAYCIIFDYEDKNLQSPRYAALRLLQIASGLPVLEKKFDWKKMMVLANDCDTVWMKRQSYIRCVGTLVRNSAKSQNKKETQILEALTSNLVMKTMRSILFIIQSDSTTDETNLSSLYSEIWRGMNAFPPKLQEITRTQILNFINEVVLSSIDASSEDQTTHIVDLILTSVLASACNTISNSTQLSYVAEYVLEKCLQILARYESKEEVEKLYDLLDDNVPNELMLWKTLCHTLGQICKVSQNELIDSCLSKSCAITTLALAQNMVDEAKACGIEANAPMYNAFFSTVQWLTVFVPNIENETKLLLLLGYVLKMCNILEEDAKLKPEAEVNLSSVGESISTLLPVMEQWSMDKVKSGILGTLGIGRATPLSIGFRVSIRCLSAHFRQIIARLQPGDGADLLTKAINKHKQSIDNMRKLSLENRVYSFESDKIHDLLDLIQNASDKHMPSSHLPIMTKIFSFYFQTDSHYLSVL